MFDKILIANRGEIAVRVIRTCRERGVGAVAVYSDPDREARHARAADESVYLPGAAPVDTYLNIGALLEAALSTGAQAVHPGYGFLSESAEFAQAVMDAGLVWIGPPPEATRAVGDKVRARNIASSAAVPLVPGVLEPVISTDVLRAFGDEHGYPLAIKAAGGGGGRGLKIARAPDEVEEAFSSARREAEAYFGSSDVYVERYLEAPKHLEVQILAPNPDEALWLGVRDCSLQRRHQKLIEETPPPLWKERMAEMGQAAVALSKACGYVNAGTVEMLVDEAGDFYFLEVNARLQVEHTVTEEVLGLDLVACQLQIAAGDPLGVTQADVETHMSGHAIECRINAEDPARGFLPASGRIDRYEEPAGLGVRVDSGYAAGDVIPDAYDSLIAKVIVRGADREEARTRMIRALEDFVLEGPSTTIPAHLLLLQHESFVSGTHTTRTVEDSGVLSGLTPEVDEGPEEDVLLVAGRPVRLWHPSMAPSASAAVHSGAPTSGELVAPMQGTIVKVLVEEGDEVEAGDAIVVLEAMKMETSLTAQVSGKVVELHATPGANAQAGQALARIE
ncbi:MAG: biotin/lipoyl-binding protein [Actinomycetota bacterium]|nr:biotin/lipoyl-binding protein [Actinomycetota bacterium]